MHTQKGKITKRYNKLKTNKMLKQKGGVSPDDKPPIRKRGKMASNSGAEPNGAAAAANMPIERIPGFVEKLEDGELPHQDEGLIHNKKNNFETFNVFQYDYDGGVGDIILVGEDHSIKPISFNVLDVLKILRIVKYDSPPEIYIEFDTYSNIPSDVPVLGEMSKGVPFLPDKEMLDLLKTEITNSEKMRLSHMGILKYSGFQTIKYVEPRNMVLIKYVLEVNSKRFEKKDMHSLFLKLFDIVTRFSVEECEKLENEFNLLYERKLLMAAIVNRYIDYVQSELKKKISLPKEIQKGITLETQKIKFTKLSTFVKRLRELVGTAEKMSQIRTFFTTVYFEFFKRDMRDFEEVFEQKKHTGFEPNITMFLIDLNVICEMESDMRQKKNITISLGSEHTKRIIEYINFLISNNINMIRNVLEYNNDAELGLVSNSKSSKSFITTAEILQSLLDKPTYARKVVMQLFDPKLGKDKVLLSFKGNN